MTPDIGDEFDCECNHCGKSVTRRYNGSKWPMVGHSHSFCKRCGEEIFWDEDFVNPKTGKMVPIDGDETAHFCEPIKCQKCGEDIALNVVDGRWVPVDFEVHEIEHECDEGHKRQCFPCKYCKAQIWWENNIPHDADGSRHDCRGMARLSFKRHEK